MLLPVFKNRQGDGLEWDVPLRASDSTIPAGTVIYYRQPPWDDVVEGFRRDQWEEARAPFFSKAARTGVHDGCPQAMLLQDADALDGGAARGADGVL